MFLSIPNLLIYKWFEFQEVSQLDQYDQVKTTDNIPIVTIPWPFTPALSEYLSKHSGVQQLLGTAVWPSAH